MYAVVCVFVCACVCVCARAHARAFVSVCIFVCGYIRTYAYTNAERCKYKKAGRYIRAVLNGTSYKTSNNYVSSEYSPRVGKSAD